MFISRVPEMIQNEAISDDALRGSNTGIMHQRSAS